MSESKNKWPWMSDYVSDKYCVTAAGAIRWKEAEQAYNEAHPCKTDYTDCHHKIAESLKRGEHVENCASWNEHGGPRRIGVEVISYMAERISPYLVVSKGSIYGAKYAEPIPKTEKRVIGKVSMMQGFEANGWELDKRAAKFVDKSKCAYGLSIFLECGEKPREEFNYEPWMIEEVEVRALPL